MTNIKIIKIFTLWILIIAGITLIWINSNWLVALGIYIMIFANNIDQSLKG